jgi:peptidoglycan/LPS O-acetylase OafA/YrhL
MSSSLQSDIRHPELDGLRGLAILLVLIWHYSRFLNPDPSNKFIRLTNITWSGVDLFFVLSGFLIGGILLDHRLSGNLFRVFYLRRAFRILPLYFLVLLSYIACLLLRMDIPYLFTGHIPIWSYATFLQNFTISWYALNPAYMGASWSLAVEEQFYLLFPLVVYFTPPRKLVFVLVAALLTAPLLRIVLYHWFSKDHFLAFYMLMPCRMDALSIGVLCAMAYRSAYFSRLFKENIGWLRPVVATSFVFLVYGIDPIFSSKLMIFGGYTVLALLYGFLLLDSILGPEGLLKRLTNLSWLRSLGKIAFSVYLFHLAVVGFAFFFVLGIEPGLSSLIEVFVAILAVLITLVLGWISWVFFERYFIAMGQIFRYQLSRPL